VAGDRKEVTSVIRGGQSSSSGEPQGGNAKLTAEEVAALDAPRAAVTDYPARVALSSGRGRSRVTALGRSLDPTPRWVPFATAGVIACVGAACGNNGYRVRDAVFRRPAVVMLVGILLQGGCSGATRSATSQRWPKL
jgi:hypothetical protein